MAAVSYRDPPEIPVADPTIRQALREIRQALIELGRQVHYRDIEVLLTPGVPTLVLHGLGRPMKGYAMGAPTGATSTGRIVESERIPDRSIVLTATGMGATVTVNLRFW